MLVGCLGGDAFLCESDEVCQQGGVSGLCQPSGYCSFPDDECATGQRYGEHAGGPLAGECVDPGSLTGDSTSDGVSTSPLTTTSSGSTSTTGVTTSTTSPTTGVDGPATTNPLSESDTGGSTGPSATGMNDEAPATTTGAPPVVVCWADEFDDGMIDAMWCPVVEQPGITIDEPRGHLRFTLTPQDWGMGSNSGWVSTCDVVPLLGAEAVTEVVSAPQVSPFTEAYLEVGNDGLRLGLGILNGELYAFVFDGMTYAGTSFQPYVPDAHRFLRVVGTDEGLVAESSPDGMAWANVYTHFVDLTGSDGTARLGTWSEMLPLGPDEAVFERFELCWLEG